MPYAKHDNIETPEPDSLRTWRYVDFTKFVSMLEHSALFFVRLSFLSEKDPLEGFLTIPTVERLRTVPEGVTDSEKARRQQVAKHNLKTMRLSRELLFVSSWHLNQNESAAMWRLYLKSDEGIAIQSTIGRMKAAFAPAKEEVHIGRVRYVDFESEEIPWNNGTTSSTWLCTSGRASRMKWKFGG